MAKKRAMKHSEFTLGGLFWCSGRQWRCTDIGSRTIIAIRIDSVDVDSNVPELRRTLSRSEAEADGWFKGPPYGSPRSYSTKTCGAVARLSPIRPTWSLQISATRGRSDA